MSENKQWCEPEFFKLGEFVCRCGCGQNNISQELLAMLDEARRITGLPYLITSGCRCWDHNKAVGGSPTSSHLASDDQSGLAVDISCPDDRFRGGVLSGLIQAGFRRIGLAKTFIHVDIDPAKPGAVWLYRR